MSKYGGDPDTLSEFMGTGEGNSIFGVPTCAAMHPPALELCPHPLRVTQVEPFLGTIACTRSQLWAGLQSGLHYWNLSNLFEGWAEGGGGCPSSNPMIGDEERTPFRGSCLTSPTLCLAVDTARGLIWSGHEDGKIRSWMIDQATPPMNQSSDWDGNSATSTADDGGNVSPFKEGLSWQAHRAPVLSLIITSYDDIWSGSEGGSIKAWPWESIEKSLSLPKEERHMAALLVERSYIDLRTQATVGGVCSLPAVDVKYLLSDNSRSKVWSASSLSFALWDSRSKELLKVFGIDGEIETRIDKSSVKDPYIEDEMKIAFVSTSRKEKSQGSVRFFQRSCDTLMGAADPVRIRRVAVQGTFGEDNRGTEALEIAMDGMIWTGCRNGSLVQWDGHGIRLQEFQHHPHSVQCICAFGTRLLVGYINGTVQVTDLEGNLLGGWVAHSSSVIKMIVFGSYIFTLANNGGIRGWNLKSLGPLDIAQFGELIASKVKVYMETHGTTIIVLRGLDGIHAFCDARTTNLDLENRIIKFYEGALKMFNIRRIVGFGYGNRRDWIHYSKVLKNMVDSCPNHDGLYLKILATRLCNEVNEGKHASNCAPLTSAGLILIDKDCPEEAWGRCSIASMSFTRGKATLKWDEGGKRGFVRGSGTRYAARVTKNWSPNMGKQATRELCVRALRCAASRDYFTGAGFIACHLAKDSRLWSVRRGRLPSVVRSQLPSVNKEGTQKIMLSATYQPYPKLEYRWTRSSKEVWEE